jgi:hypothetical protein
VFVWKVVFAVTAFSWTVNVSGNFMIVAAWQGNLDYNPATASITVHT